MDKKNIFRIVSIFFITVQTFSIISGYINLYLDRLSVFIVLLALLFYPKSFYNKQTFYLLVYVLIKFVYLITGIYNTDIQKIILDNINPLICLVIINVFLYNKDYKWMKINLVVGLVIIVLISFFSINILNNNSSAARNMVSYLEESVSTDNLKSGLASYGLIHSFPFIVPLLIYRLKTNTSYYIRFVFLVAIALPVYIIIKSSFFTPIIFVFINLILSLLITNDKKKNFYIISSFLFLLFLVYNKDFLISFLYYIQTLFSYTEVDAKIIELIDIIKYSELTGQYMGRYDLYSISLNTFFSNPIIGGDTHQVGGHSYIIDRLAIYGLFGVVPFLLFFFYSFKTNFLLSVKNSRKYLLISFFSFFLFSFLKNINGIEFYIYLIIFLPALSIEEKTIIDPNFGFT